MALLNYTADHSNQAILHKQRARNFEKKKLMRKLVTNHTYVHNTQTVLQEKAWDEAIQPSIWLNHGLSFHITDT